MTIPATDVYLKNMAALWRRDSRLAYAIDQLPAESSLVVESSKAGPPTASALTADGRRLYLHSRYDPVGEAERFCATLDEGADRVVVAVLCGLGLGHHVAPLRERLGPEGTIIVSEPDLVTIKTALEHTDLSDAIRAQRLVLLHTLDKGDLHAKLDPHSSSLMIGTRFLVPPAAQQLAAAFHQQVRAAVTDFASYARMSLVTLLANARITCENIASNLPAYVATSGIEPLHNRFRGYPAVLVAAGPSLARNVDQLIAARDRVVVIAMQTTLKPLLARGIRPDFVTSLDFSDLSKRFFEGVDAAGVHLIAEPKAAWQVIDTFLGGAPGRADRPPRRLTLLYNEFACRCLGDDLGRRAGLRAGSTVAHLAFYLAEFLGCDPIVLIGQDLGFSGGVYYAPGVAIHDLWRPELGRFGSLEMKEWERITRARSILHLTQDIHGRPIYTDDQMFTYLQQFERDFAACAARVIDATEGGVRKTGTRIMPLAEALEHHAARPIPRELRDAGMSERLDGARLPAARDVLRKRLDELAEFRGLCDETRGLVSEMKDCVDRPAEFNRRIVRIDELRAMVHERDRTFRMVSDLSQLGEWQKFSADRRLSLDTARKQASGGLTPAQRAVRQLDRDGRFVAALIEGCDVLERTLREALARMEAAIAEAGAA